METLEKIFEELLSGEISEQKAAGQQIYTYHNGYKMENPNRQQVREPYTREELETIYNNHIAASAKHWGDKNYYTNQAREIKSKNISSWSDGKVVVVYSEEYTEDCTNYADTYYSDGTKVTTCYGYDD